MTVHEWPLSKLVTALNDADRLELSRSLGLENPSGEQLAEQLRDPNRIRKLLSQWSDNTLSLLKRWVQQGGEVALYGYEAASFHQAVNEMKDSGLFFSLTNQFDRTSYWIPIEYYPILMTTLFPIPDDIVSSVTTPRAVHAAPGWWPVFHDLFQLLSFSEDGRLMITQSGTIYRRVLAKLLQRSWPEGTPNHKEARLNLAVAFARTERLLVYDTDFREFLPTETVQTFFEQEVAVLWERYLRYALEGQPGLFLQHALVTHARRLEPEQWLDLDVLSDWLTAHHFRNSKNSYALGEIRRQLSFLGLWEENGNRGRLSDLGYAALHQSFEPSEAGQVIIQPTGDVLVPPQTPFRERWALQKIAILVKTDRVASYQINRHSVSRALSLGLTQDDYLRTLSNISRMDLPGNLVSNIQDWFQSLSRHRFVHAMVIHSQSPDDSRRVEGMIGEHLLARLSSTDVIISDKHVEEIHRKLEKSGVLIRKDIWRPGESPKTLEPTLPDEPIGTVALPQPMTEKTPSNPGQLQHEIHEAILSQRPLHILMTPSGRDHPLPITIIPWMLSDGWIQAMDVDTHQQIMLSLKQVVSVLH